MATEVLTQLRALRESIAETLRKDPRYLTLAALDKSIVEISGVLTGAGLVPPQPAPIEPFHFETAASHPAAAAPVATAPAAPVPTPPAPEPTAPSVSAVEIPTPPAEEPVAAPEPEPLAPAVAALHEPAAEPAPKEPLVKPLVETAAALAVAGLVAEVVHEEHAKSAAKPASEPETPAPEPEAAAPHKAAEIHPEPAATTHDATTHDADKTHDESTHDESTHDEGTHGDETDDHEADDQGTDDHEADEEADKEEAAAHDEAAEHKAETDEVHHDTIEADKGAHAAAGDDAEPLEDHHAKADDDARPHAEDANHLAQPHDAPHEDHDEKGHDAKDDHEEDDEKHDDDEHDHGKDHDEAAADPAVIPRNRASGYTPMQAKPGAAQYQPAMSVKFGKLPNKVDLRPLMTPVEDQGDTSSCVANAVAGAYEYWIKKASKQDHAISRLFVYYNARWRDGSQDKDEGSVIQLAMEGLAKFGACSEKVWPFDPHLILKMPGADAYQDAAPYKVHDMAQVPTKIEAWKQALAEGKPIVFGCELFDSFDECTNRGGVVPMPAPDDIARKKHSGHSMCAVGYSDSEKVFIVRNSWGADFGDKGYCYMPFAYLMSPKFNDGDCWVFIPKVPSQPPREVWSDDTKPVTNGGEGVDFPIETYTIADYEKITIDLFESVRKPFNGVVLQDFSNYVSLASKGLWSEMESFDFRTFIASTAALAGIAALTAEFSDSLSPSETLADKESDAVQDEDEQADEDQDDDDAADEDDDKDEEPEDEEPENDDKDEDDPDEGDGGDDNASPDKAHAG